MTAPHLNGEAGASGVEMSIITLLLFLLLLGGIDWGLYFYNKHVLTWGTREAARWGVTIDVTADTNSYRRTLPNIESYARTYYQDRLIPAGSSDEVVIVLERTDKDGATCTVPVTDNPCHLRVQATYDYNLFFASFLGVNLPDLVAVSKMYME